MAQHAGNAPVGLGSHRSAANALGAAAALKRKMRTKRLATPHRNPCIHTATLHGTWRTLGADTHAPASPTAPSAAEAMPGMRNLKRLLSRPMQLLGAGCCSLILFDPAVTGTIIMGEIEP